MGTPEERARQLEGVFLRAALQERRSQDLAHMPGGSVTNAITRSAYWEQRAEELEGRYWQADGAWRNACVEAGPYPDPWAAAHCAQLEAERNRLANERSRACQLRDAAIAEAESAWRAPLPPDLHSW